MIVPWLDASERSGMPVDPRLWAEAPLSSSLPGVHGRKGGGGAGSRTPPGATCARCARG